MRILGGKTFLFSGGRGGYKILKKVVNFDHFVQQCPLKFGLQENLSEGKCLVPLLLDVNNFAFAKSIKCYQK